MPISTVLLLLTFVPVAISVEPPQDIPNQRGSVWIYKGTMRRRKDPAKPPAFVTRPVTVTVTVTDTVHRAQLYATLLSGFPQDLYHNGTGQGKYALVESGRRIYLVGPERAQTVFARLKDPEDGLYDLVNESEQLFGTPLAIGQKYCEAKQITRDDNMYCWIVTGSVPFDTTGVRGLSRASVGIREYTVTYRANDGYSLFGIVPGVGITAFSFESTCAACGDKAEVRLTEYRAKAR